MAVASALMIEMNFAQAKKQAAELEAIASKIEKLASDSMANNMSQISANWKGENSEAYVKKYQTLQNKVSKSAGELRKAAQTIRTIAANTYKAEMAALALAGN